MLQNLAKKSGDAIVLHYVPLEDLADTFLEGNSKKHDTTKIINSIQRYGFRDPIAFDSTLNDGNGGIIEGNGRLESLLAMKEQKMNLPRGIKDDWRVPVIFGIDSTSEAEAIAFSIEHNWSVLWGSDLDIEASLSLFDEETLTTQMEWLNENNSIPISIGTDLDKIISSLNEEFEQAEQEDAGEDMLIENWGVVVNLEDEQEQLELLEKLTEEGYNCKALM